MTDTARDRARQTPCTGCDGRGPAPCAVCPAQPSRDGWEGRIRRIAPSADEASRTFRAFVEVNNVPGAPPLIPGLFVEAAVAGDTLHDVMLIPRGAVRKGLVYVLHDE
jgi:multidrug efflux pump subunit AcrA (membrane-fusion protein)